MTLGPRILKTGLAVVLALYITQWLGLEKPVFAGVAATFTIQPSIYRSWKQVLEQVQANVLGAAIALASIYVFGNSPIIIGLVMIIVILVCLKLNMEGAISLTLITVLVMMSAPAYEGLLAAAEKLVVVLVGMGSAFLVNILVAPPNYKENFMEKAESTFRNMSLLLRTAISNEMVEKSFREQWDKLRSDISRMEDLYKILDEEREKISKLKPLDVREIVVFKQMLTCLQQGLELLDIIEDHFFQTNPDEEASLLFDRQLEQLISYHEMILLKFDGKIKANQPGNEDEMIQDSGSFLEEVMEAYRADQGEKLRLVVIGSIIFDYAFQLGRLNHLIDQYIKKKRTSEKRDTVTRRLFKLLPKK
ncbi:FUSC family protein [Bacillus sp. T33-2]|uniref:FUSC family protein n=1 Tax=Bacillus sp. T33-2 TaxID=2054168 RepID=UPI000C7909E9|nr:aromatic acid exporter family protein [Bacillus sp. T33-2]PLR95147.1 hypothetical protein CVD19_15590 [Bacillus sp. T33-2]